MLRVVGSSLKMVKFSQHFWMLHDVVLVGHFPAKMLCQSMRPSSICYFKAPSDMLQQIAIKNVAICCVEMLRVFGRVKGRLVARSTKRFLILCGAVSLLSKSGQGVQEKNAIKGLQWWNSESMWVGHFDISKKRYWGKYIDANRGSLGVFWNHPSEICFYMHFIYSNISQ